MKLDKEQWIKDIYNEGFGLNAGDKSGESLKRFCPIKIKFS